jgi:hypothetical protein
VKTAAPEKDLLMQGNDSSRTDLTSLARSEQKIRAFIEAALLTPRLDGDLPLILVARSVDSVVARALFSLGDRVAGRHLACRIVVTSNDKQVDRVTNPTPAFTHEIRVVSDARVLDGHEQLVIGDGSIWFGDCMRRDPAKRDGFESFTHGDARAARMARQTFAKLWTLGKPVHVKAGPALSHAPLNEPVPVGLEELVPLDLQGTLDGWRPQTRH